MIIKSQNYKVKGMRRDESYSAFNPEYSWSNKNIRLTARDSNDLLSVTNEKGNKSLLFNDKRPLPLIEYTWVSKFNNYVYEEENTSYTWISEFVDYKFES